MCRKRRHAGRGYRDRSLRANQQGLSREPEIAYKPLEKGEGRQGYRGGGENAAGPPESGEAEENRWQGGEVKDKKTSAYAEKLKDPRWQKKRLEIFERDKWTCQKCGVTDKTLAVHHLKYDGDKDPWDYPKSWLATLCEDCHADEYENRQYNEQKVLECLRLWKFWSDDLSRLAWAIYATWVQDKDSMLKIADSKLQEAKAKIKEPK